MKLVELVGGGSPSAIVHGTREEISNLGHLLGESVLIIDAKGDPLDASPEILWARMNGHRIGRGLSWRTVADEMGVSPSTLTRWGQGRHPSARALLAASAWCVANSGPTEPESDGQGSTSCP